MHAETTVAEMDNELAQASKLTWGRLLTLNLTMMIVSYGELYLLNDHYGLSWLSAMQFMAMNTFLYTALLGLPSLVPVLETFDWWVRYLGAIFAIILYQVLINGVVIAGTFAHGVERVPWHTLDPEAVLLPPILFIGSVILNIMFLGMYRDNLRFVHTNLRLHNAAIAMPIIYVGLGLGFFAIIR